MYVQVSLARLIGTEGETDNAHGGGMKGEGLPPHRASLSTLHTHKSLVDMTNMVSACAKEELVVQG